MFRLPHYAFLPRAAFGEGGHGALLEIPAEIHVGLPEGNGEGCDKKFEGRFVHAEEEDAIVEAVVVAGCEEEGGGGEGVDGGWEENVKWEQGVDD